MDKPDRIGKTFVGQGWIELHGSFSFHELRLIARQLEENVHKARNGDKK